MSFLKVVVKEMSSLVCNKFFFSFFNGLGYEHFSIEKNEKL